jgi:hypothetical protein
MDDSRKLNFYGDKPASLPRLVYRRLRQALTENPGARNEATTAAIAELLTEKNPDFRKFKFFIPEFLKGALSREEFAHLAAATAGRRSHSSRLKMVYPHVSDEFSVDLEFLASILDIDSGPKIDRPARFFTIGSCFARNIANFLRDRDYDAEAYELAEDLNSPTSNAFIFDLIQLSAQERLRHLTHWTQVIYPELEPAEAKHWIDSQVERISRLAIKMSQANCVILTLGNIVDFFKDNAPQSAALPEKIFPKFVAMSGSENLVTQAAAASRLKSKGATLRLASYDETQEAISRCIRGIRAITQAPIVVTLSPVPIDSVLGLTDSTLRSAIEVDCVSKSRLRSAFNDVFSALGHANASIYYFPSFEIVRWIAPMLSIPSFGLDDAASRHVSSPILESICSLFTSRFIKVYDHNSAHDRDPMEMQTGTRQF